MLFLEYDSESVLGVGVTFFLASLANISQGKKNVNKLTLEFS